MCFHTTVWHFHNSGNHLDLGEKQPGKLRCLITAGVLLDDAHLYHLERVQENKI